MQTAILLDGSKNPVSIRLNAQEAAQAKSGQKKSISWSGSAEGWRQHAERPARHFNFLRTVERREGDLYEEVLVYLQVGVKADSLVLGLNRRELDIHARAGTITVEEQGDLLAEQFLYPEKFAEMGRVEAAVA